MMPTAVGKIIQCVNRMHVPIPSKRNVLYAASATTRLRPSRFAR
jgi:hypothetical protein